MADLDAWGLGLIAAPAAGDRVPIATGANVGGYSLRGSFVWKNASGNFEAQTSAGLLSIAPSGSASVKLLSSATMQYDVAGSSAHQFLIGGTQTAQIGQISGEQFRLITTAARGGGNIFLAFRDPSGRKGYVGYGSSSHDDMFIMNEMNRNLIFGTNGQNRLTLDITGNLTPAIDNAQAFGWSSARWSVLYAVTGTINTCDVRLKFYRAEPAPSADEHAAVLECHDAFGFFQHLDAIAREQDGGPPARWHFGPKAQDVWSIFAAHGLAPALVEDEHGDLVPPPGSVPPAFLCFDAWGEERGDVLAWWRPSEVLGPDGQPVMVQCAEGEEGTEQRPTGETYVVRPAGNIFGIRIDQLQSLMLVALNKERKDHAARIAALEAAA